MSIYSDLLRFALAAYPESADAELSVEELVERLSEKRMRFPATLGTTGRGAPSASECMADFVAHDVVLVRLCERLNIGQMLTDPWSSPNERDRLISVLADRGFDLGALG